MTIRNSNNLLFQLSKLMSFGQVGASWPKLSSFSLPREFYSEPHLPSPSPSLSPSPSPSPDSEFSSGARSRLRRKLSAQLCSRFCTGVPPLRGPETADWVVWWLTA
ncbi:Ff.00g099020.m01.CDS01 [Fusarium sp. VM40]|nr:Ff.00g099020.m01.CDS01 [Fusarium sp. VM40]